MRITADLSDPQGGKRSYALLATRALLTTRSGVGSVSV